MSVVWDKLNDLTKGYSVDGVLDVKRLRREHPDLAEFHAQGIVAILAMKAAGRRLDGTISDQEWLKLRGCGYKFLEKLLERGWATQAPVWETYSNRVEAVLRSLGIKESDVEGIRIAIREGAIRPGMLHGFGVGSYEFLCANVGLKSTIPESRHWKFDPFTGEPLSPGSPDAAPR